MSMQETKDFISSFLETEKHVSYYYLRQEIEPLNKGLDQLNTFVVPELFDSFGMIHQDEVNEDIKELYKDDELEIKARHLFKIEKYENCKLPIPILYLTYLSRQDPLSKKYAECFAISMIEGSLKIIAKFILINPSLDSYEWSFTGGNRDIIPLLKMDNDKRISDCKASLILLEPEGE